MGLGDFFNGLVKGIPLVGPVVSGVESLFGGDDGNQRLQDVGGILGGAAGGAANRNLQSGQLSAQLYDAALRRALSQASLPSLGAAQAVKGDMLQNVQDVQPSGSPAVMAHLVNFSGGLRPSALGPNARQAGANLSKAGVANQSLQLPQAPEMPSSLLPNILGGTGLSASLIAALRKGVPTSATPQNGNFLPFGPPAPDDPWNGDDSMYGGG